jgi:hypothetical protein
MKLLIQQGDTKRQLEGSFNLCASRADLELLRQQIDTALSCPDFHYGWMPIYSDVPVALPNSQPLQWSDRS